MARCLRSKQGPALWECRTRGHFFSHRSRWFPVAQESSTPLAWPLMNLAFNKPVNWPYIHQQTTPSCRPAWQFLDPAMDICAIWIHHPGIRLRGRRKKISWFPKGQPRTQSNNQCHCVILYIYVICCIMFTIHLSSDFIVISVCSFNPRPHRWLGGHISCCLFKNFSGRPQVSLAMMGISVRLVRFFLGEPGSSGEPSVPQNLELQ